MDFLGDVLNIALKPKKSPIHGHSAVVNMSRQTALCCDFTEIGFCLFRLKKNSYSYSFYLAVHGSDDAVCRQQADSSFHLLQLGDTDLKESCHDLCCQHPKCHVAVHSGKLCGSLYCGYLQ